MVIHIENSVGRAKLRHLTNELEMSLEALSIAIGPYRKPPKRYRGSTLSMAANGISAGNGLIAALEAFTREKSRTTITVEDWTKESEEDCSKIKMYDERGRPRGNGQRGQTWEAHERLREKKQKLKQRLGERRPRNTSTSPSTRSAPPSTPLTPVMPKRRRSKSSSRSEH